MTKKKPYSTIFKLLKGFIQLKFNAYFLLSLFTILTGTWIYYTGSGAKTFFPDNGHLTQILLTDSVNGGHSVITKHLLADSVMHVEFELREGFVSPYVGVSLQKKTDARINLKPSNQIQFEVETYGIEYIGFNLYTSAFRTDKENKINELCYYYSLPVNDGRHVYTLEIEQLKIPDWYITVNKIPYSENIKPDLSKVILLNITTGYITKPIVQGSMRIYNITFYRNNTLLIITLILIGLTSVVVLFILHVLRINSGKKQVQLTIDYNPVHFEKETRSSDPFLDYINRNFHDCELTLNQVSHHTGINQRRIASSIQETFGCNFKTYINQIRINESKRLLKNSDLNIGEIAFKVGFNNQSHYNRVFKSIEGVNPTEYRERNT